MVSYQHCIGHVGEHARSGQRWRGAQLCATAVLPKRRRAGAGGVGAGQHCGRIAIEPRLRAARRRADAAAGAASRHRHQARHAP